VRSFDQLAGILFGIAFSLYHFFQGRGFVRARDKEDYVARSVDRVGGQRDSPGLKLIDVNCEFKSGIDRMNRIFQDWPKKVDDRPF